MTFGPDGRCPCCWAMPPFDQFLPRLVRRRAYRWFLWGAWPTFAVICRVCKNIVGWEW